MSTISQVKKAVESVIPSAPSNKAPKWHFSLEATEKTLGELAVMTALSKALGLSKTDKKGQDIETDFDAYGDVDNELKRLCDEVETNGTLQTVMAFVVSLRGDSVKQIVGKHRTSRVAQAVL